MSSCKLLIIVSSVLILIDLALCDDVLVELPFGTLRGLEVETFTNKKYYSFQKIPYAAPPVGNLRFKDPIPHEKWDGILNATKLDVVCYQVRSDSPQESEDCLFINVYTPELPTADKNVSLPVLIYIYGGGFFSGQATEDFNGPQFLIDQDIVVVSLNYRLGPFGFLSTQDAVIPGNAGLKDQQFAIKWTHDNIKFFGGDPEKITISGQSAGGASVAHQLLYTPNAGLFRGAIMESATALCPWSLQRDARAFAFMTAGLIDASFNSSDDSLELLNFLQGVSAQELDDASRKVDAWHISVDREQYTSYAYAPVIEADNELPFIRKNMYERFKAGEFLKVPIIIGFNSQEAQPEALNLELLKAKMVGYDENLDWLVPEDMRIEDIMKKKELGEDIRTFYTDGQLLSDNLASGIHYIGDNRFNRPIRKHAELQSHFTDVYFYQFSYEGLMGNNDITFEGAEGVAHSEELYYIWHVAGGTYDNSDTSKYPPADFITQRRMVKLWSNFVKTLNPTPENSDLFQNVVWPTVSSTGDFQYLDINNNLGVNSDPKGDTYKKWEEIYADLGYDDFDTY